MPTLNRIPSPPSRPVRRFTDSISDLNADVYDSARLLARAVELVDHLGLHIIAVEADRSRNQRLQVTYSPACDQLDGAQTACHNGYCHWTANKFGVEIRWCLPIGEAA